MSVKQVVEQVRDMAVRGCQLPPVQMSKARNVVSLVLYGVPYSDAVAAERAGKAPRPHIDSDGAARVRTEFGLDPMPVIKAAHCFVGLIDHAAVDDEERAMDLVSEAAAAAEAGMGSRAVELARAALAEWPDCPDAWTLLADQESSEVSVRLAHARRAVECARKHLPEWRDDYDKGVFGDSSATRPLMRALHVLGIRSIECADYRAAAGCFREMLRLGRRDGAGARYFLSTCLVALGDFPALDRLYKKYPPAEGEVCMHYDYVLSLYLREGESALADTARRAAIARNHLVAQFLAKRVLPEELLGVPYSEGSHAEAVQYAAYAGPIWRREYDALMWLSRGASGTLPRRQLPSRHPGAETLGPIPRARRLPREPTATGPRLRELLTRGPTVWGHFVTGKIDTAVRAEASGYIQILTVEARGLSPVMDWCEYSLTEKGQHLRQALLEGRTSTETPRQPDLAWLLAQAFAYRWEGRGESEPDYDEEMEEHELGALAYDWIDHACHRLGIDPSSDDFDLRPDRRGVSGAVLTRLSTAPRMSLVGPPVALSFDLCRNAGGRDPVVLGAALECRRGGRDPLHDGFNRHPKAVEDILRYASGLTLRSSVGLTDKSRRSPRAFDGLRAYFAAEDPDAEFAIETSLFTSRTPVQSVRRSVLVLVALYDVATRPLDERGAALLAHRDAILSRGGARRARLPLD